MYKKAGRSVPAPLFCLMAEIINNQIVINEVILICKIANS